MPATGGGACSLTRNQWSLGSRVQFNHASWTYTRLLMNVLNGRLADSCRTWVCFVLALWAHPATPREEARAGVLSSLCSGGIWRLERPSQVRFTAELPENLPPISDRRPVLSDSPSPLRTNRPWTKKTQAGYAVPHGMACGIVPAVANNWASISHYVIGR